ncbi:MAG TPA: type II toxin-antitoxin system PemK/MazF family toxin [Acetobacteraceae bacterium]|nr:type II toxin-antitoxin system PemK/MazF family toxin [Acetobacteraceae bacterium]
MALPRAPFPGLIVRYAFLWSDEAQQGRSEARKDRPCVIVVAVRRQSDSRFRVRVLPITHTPQRPDRAVALPAKVKRHLGLDDEASWIVLDEANEFVWPGVDLRPISRAKPGVWSYGVLPQEVFAEVQTRLRAVLGQGRVMRDE